MLLIFLLALLLGAVLLFVPSKSRYSIVANILLGVGIALAFAPLATTFWSWAIGGFKGEMFSSEHGAYLWLYFYLAPLSLVLIAVGAALKLFFFFKK
jgi:hypothetical protein